MPLDLTERTGLPEDLRVLFKDYPREVWENHKNFGEMTQFWLTRHAMFRALSRELTKACEAFLDKKIGADELAQAYEGRSKLFVEQLHLHHRIEEEVFFPQFVAADDRYDYGFDIFELDHETIHAALIDVQQRSIKMQGALKTLDAQYDIPTLVEATYRTFDRMRALLQRHLCDEEELIVPMILKRGEAAFGLAK